jgi:hypothetical protein
MSLVNITDTNIEPKSLHFTDGGIFDADPASDTLQTADWSQVIPQTGLTDNQQVVVQLGSSFNTGHAYHISSNIALNVLPSGGYGTQPDTFLNSWETGCKMGDNVIYSTISHWTSINSSETMGTTNASIPASFIVVVDTSRTLSLYLTANSDYFYQGVGGAGLWSINSDPTYIVTGKVSYIDLGQVTIIQQGIPPTPPPQPIPPVFDPVPDLLTTQGGIYNHLAGFVSPYVYPTI